MSKVTQLSLNRHKCFLSPKPLFLLLYSACKESSTKLRINKAATCLSKITHRWQSSSKWLILISPIQFSKHFWILIICLTIDFKDRVSALKKCIVWWGEQTCTCHSTNPSLLVGMAFCVPRDTEDLTQWCLTVRTGYITFHKEKTMK